jgi:hypothetical protein
MEQKSLSAIAFVRCSGPATVADELVPCLGLAEATRVAMSGVIVLQQRLHQTLSFLTRRIRSTIFGVGLTIAVSEIAFCAASSTACNWRSQ